MYKQTENTTSACILNPLISVAILVFLTITLIINLDPGFKISELRFDGIALHKTGELLIGFGYCSLFILCNLSNKNQIKYYFLPAYLFILSGGILNLFAWKLVRYGYYWHSWCIALFVLSILSFIFLKIIIRFWFQKMDKKSTFEM